MRQNRLSQRLKTKLDSFGFDALIKGVSTLVEEAAAVEPDAPEEERLADTMGDGRAPTSLDARDVAEPSAIIVEASIHANVFEMLPAVKRSEIFEIVQITETLEARLPETPPAARLVEAPGAGHPLPVAAGNIATLGAPRIRQNSAPQNLNAPEQLRDALHALSCRLTQEAGRLAVALERHDAQEAGFYLAHVNQILELLHTIDARGDLARHLEVPNAPPFGRTWPLTAWTVVEFAESPFSGLLPADADEHLVRDVIYAAWGISFAGE